jgi:hypothetical protein|tara:strand:- start:5950 stop:6087 length:138 start_codon:yes stop_codon:yes gene_type:complete
MAEIIIIATNDLLEKLRQVVLPNRKKKEKYCQKATLITSYQSLKR